MKKFAAYVLLTALSLSVKAQSFSVTENYVTLAGPANATEIPSAYWSPTIYNTSGDTLTLRWIRVEENIPAWWRSSICTEYYCFSIPDDSATWTLLPGDSDMIYIHMYPYGYSDTGNVVVKLFDVNNPSDSTRVMFHADIGVGVEEQAGPFVFRMDLFRHSVSVTDHRGNFYTLMDATGRVVEQVSAQPYATQTFTVETPGVYFLRKESEDGSAEVIKLLL
jgi:hypothetical protein